MDVNAQITPWGKLRHLTEDLLRPGILPALLADREWRGMWISEVDRCLKLIVSAGWTRAEEVNSLIPKPKRRCPITSRGFHMLLSRLDRLLCFSRK